MDVPGNTLIALNNIINMNDLFRPYIRHGSDRINPNLAYLNNTLRICNNINYCFLIDWDLVADTWSKSGVYYFRDLETYQCLNRGAYWVELLQNKFSLSATVFRSTNPKATWNSLRSNNNKIVIDESELVRNNIVRIHIPIKYINKFQLIVNSLTNDNLILYSNLDHRAEEVWYRLQDANNLESWGIYLGDQACFPGKIHYTDQTKAVSSYYDDYAYTRLAMPSASNAVHKRDTRKYFKELLGELKNEINALSLTLIPFSHLSTVQIKHNVFDLILNQLIGLACARDNIVLLSIPGRGFHSKEAIWEDSSLGFIVGLDTVDNQSISNIQILSTLYSRERSVLDYSVKTKIANADATRASAHAARAAIMARDMSHNFGSHILAAGGLLHHPYGVGEAQSRIVVEQTQFLVPDEKPIDPDGPDFVPPKIIEGDGLYGVPSIEITQLNQFLQQRMDFIAQAVAESPGWAEPLYLMQDVLRPLFNQYLYLCYLLNDQGYGHNFIGRDQARAIENLVFHVDLPSETLNRKDKQSKAKWWRYTYAPCLDFHDSSKQRDQSVLRAEWLPQPPRGNGIGPHVWRQAWRCMRHDWGWRLFSVTALNDKGQGINGEEISLVDSGPLEGNQKWLGEPVIKYEREEKNFHYSLELPPIWRPLDRRSTTKKVPALEGWQSKDLLIALPGGVIGAQALFAILENVMRNSAKYVGKDDRAAHREKSGPYEVFFRIEKEIIAKSQEAVQCEASQRYSVLVWDSLSSDPKLSAERAAPVEINGSHPEPQRRLDCIRKALRRPLLDEEGRPEMKGRGVLEIKECGRMLAAPHFDKEAAVNDISRAANSLWRHDRWTKVEEQEEDPLAQYFASNSTDRERNQALTATDQAVDRDGNRVPVWAYPVDRHGYSQPSVSKGEQYLAYKFFLQKPRLLGLVLPEEIAQAALPEEARNVGVEVHAAKRSKDALLELARNPAQIGVVLVNHSNCVEILEALRSQVQDGSTSDNSPHDELMHHILPYRLLLLCQGQCAAGKKTLADWIYDQLSQETIEKRSDCGNVRDAAPQSGGKPLPKRRVFVADVNRLKCIYRHDDCEHSKSNTQEEPICLNSVAGWKSLLKCRDTRVWERLIIDCYALWLEGKFHRPPTGDAQSKRTNDAQTTPIGVEQPKPKWQLIIAFEREINDAGPQIWYKRLNPEPAAAGPEGAAAATAPDAAIWGCLGELLGVTCVAVAQGSSTKNALASNCATQQCDSLASPSTVLAGSSETATIKGKTKTEIRKFFSNYAKACIAFDNHGRVVPQIQAIDEEAGDDNEVVEAITNQYEIGMGSDVKLFNQIQSPPDGLGFQLLLCGLLEAVKTRILVIDERVAQETHRMSGGTDKEPNFGHLNICYHVVKDGSANYPEGYYPVCGIPQDPDEKVLWLGESPVWEKTRISTSRPVTTEAKQASEHDIIIVHQGDIDKMQNNGVWDSKATARQLYAMAPVVLITSGRGRNLAHVPPSLPFLDFSSIQDNISPRYAKYHLTRACGSVVGSVKPV